MPPGFLAVISDPGSLATLAEFQDWYNNEHVPLRMDHLKSFLSGARYSAADGLLPGWLAMYEIDDASSFDDPSYTVLREKRSEREKELIGRLGVLDRRTAEVVLDSGANEEKSTSLRPGKPSPFVVTVGIEDAEELEKFVEGTKRIGADWVRTRVMRVFDKGVTGKHEEWTKIEVQDYLGVIGE